MEQNPYGGYLKKSSLEAFQKIDRHYRDNLARADGQEKADAYYRGVDAKREATVAQFPHTIVVEATWPELDLCCRRCWQCYGPPQVDVCYEYSSEYPGCPLVLETMVVKTGKDKDGNEWSEPEYKDPGKHGHDGEWTLVGLGKTGYDYGFAMFCFKNEADLKSFSEVCDKLGMGERYS